LKWLGLIILLAAAVPLWMRLRGNPGFVAKVTMLIGFLPFGTDPLHLYMAVVSWPEWPGYVKGVELTVLDVLAAALYLGLPRGRDAVPFRLSMAFYFVAVLLSAFQADVPTAALFYAWQLARMFLVFAAVSRACTDRAAAKALFVGMAAGLCMEAGVAVWQRFALGILQATGTAGHQNTLGLMSHLIVLPSFALLLSGRRGWLPVIVLLAGLAVEVLTTSRASIGLAVAGYALTFVLSCVRQWTSRKALLLLTASAALAVATPVVLSSFDQRFAVEQPSDYDERAAFVAAASLMVSDHPLGVGANGYVLAANVEGYNARAGVVPTETSLSAHVHNVYWLVTAETGYLGLITFLFVLLRPVIVAFGCGLRVRDDDGGDLLLGIGVALLIVYAHCLFEWTFLTFQPQYMFAVELGLMVGTARRLGYGRRPGALRLPVGSMQARPAAGLSGSAWP
jgi:O-antigen ligase